MNAPSFSSAPIRGKLYSIPAWQPFIETFARGIVKQATDKESPFADISLAEWLVFLPSRRACAELRQALLRLSAPSSSQTDDVAHAVLLPRLIPLGDTGEEEDERELVSALRRRLLLAQLIEGWLDAKEDREKAGEQNENLELQETQAAHRPSAQAAPATISLARALENLQADFAREEVNPQETLTADMVPDNCATHWHEAHDFLRIVIDKWPQMLEDENLSDPDVELVRRLARRGEEITECKVPVIVAGSTGRLKATARLMRVVLSLDKGQVVLPGCPAPLETSSRHALFDEGQETTHPLHPFCALFASWEMAQEQVAKLLECYPLTSPPSSARRARLSLLAQAFSKCPAPLPPPFDSEKPTGLTVLPCAEAQEEADLVALILREALEEKGQRAALVTRDRTLARRVRSALKGRWNLAIEDTAQQPLAESPAAQIFLLTLKTLTAENLAPIQPRETDAMHPLDIALDVTALKALFARTGGEIARAWQTFEGDVLRKSERDAPTKTQRAVASLQALSALLEKSRRSDEEKTTKLAQALATLTPLAELLSGGSSTAGHPPRLALLRCHRLCAENFVALCQSENENSESENSDTPAASILPHLYHEKGGRELKRFCDTLEQHWEENKQKEDSEKENTKDYPPTLEALLAAESYGGEYATHPRLAILGALEARLLSFDLLVLGGMTEGSWPAPADKSPFLPESLREKVGLKPVEHNVGLSALDFVNFASAPKEVVATYAARHSGQPQQPSRFLQRLQACHPCRNPAFEAERRAWLTQIQKTTTTMSLPAIEALSQSPHPRAPQAARPLRVSLTSLRRLDEDPYSLYAQQVLRLNPLESLLAKEDPTLYGKCLHACFEEMLRNIKQEGKQHETDFLPAELLKSIIAKQLTRFAPSRFAQAFWQEPLLRSAQQMLGHLKALKPRRLWCEVKGEYRLTLENGRNLTLSARADLVVEAQDGGWWLIDHKTGALPSLKSLGNLEEPQLVLGAWLLQQGAFRAEGKALQPARLAQSCYWRFSGRRAENRVLVIDDKVWKKRNQDKDDAKDKPTTFETAENFAQTCFDRYATLLQHFDREETPYHAYALSAQKEKYDPYRHLARRRAWSFDSDLGLDSD